MALHGGIGLEALTRVVIRAEAQFDGRPLALEEVYFPSLIGAYAKALADVATVVVSAPSALHARLRDQLRAASPTDVELIGDYSPNGSDVVFDLSDVYYPSVLRDSVRRASRLPETPAWKIRSGGDISRAAATLERHDLYVAARYLVIPVARRLAHALRPTRVSPNTITALSCLAGVAGAAVVWLPGLWPRIAALLFLHVSITLDFSDGFLARLRGTESRVGYWFDTFLDEVVNFALLLSMTGQMVVRGSAWGVVAGIGAMLFYHVLSYNLWLTKALEGGDITVPKVGTGPRRRTGIIGMIHRLYSRLTALDFQLYVAGLALATRMELAFLTLYGAVFAYSFVRLVHRRLSTGSL